MLNKKKNLCIIHSHALIYISVTIEKSDTSENTTISHSLN